MYPTQFSQTKNEVLKYKGGANYQSQPKLSLKTYREGERKSYMNDRMSEIMRSDTTVKLKVQQNQDFNRFNNSVGFLG